MLTGCPLSSLDIPGSTSTTTTTTAVTMMGCSSSMPAECDDGNPCTEDTCEEGVCTYRPADKGTKCPDASACNGEETCDGAGQCLAGTPAVIDDGDACTLDVCDPKTGELTHPASPACGAWEPTPTAGAPFARTGHTAVWTGTEMIVWGGEVASADDPAGVTATGGRYDPETKTWKATSTTNAPPPRHSHVALWTGDKMLVWGGYGDSSYENTGGVYDPATDSWTAMTAAGAPEGRTQHRAVWTGAEMIVWGGFNSGPIGTGGRYDPAADSWTAMPVAVSPRYGHSAVWTGSRMIVWGGNDNFDWHQDGRFFDPATGWGEATSVMNAAGPREGHITAWTGAQMLVWGGFDGGAQLDTGGAFDPGAPSGGAWTEITQTGAPAGRQKHTGVWAGSQLMVWGGCGGDACSTTFADGGMWQPGPSGGAWKALEDKKVTTGRINATSVWTGQRVIVWGGKAGLLGQLLKTGAQSTP